jgi:hypothetical protein
LPQVACVASKQIQQAVNRGISDFEIEIVVYDENDIAAELLGCETSSVTEIFSA